jgi:ABC-type nitrate/sulfonate/bicarbonate transport system permease component
MYVDPYADEDATLALVIGYAAGLIFGLAIGYALGRIGTPNREVFP